VRVTYCSRLLLLLKSSESGQILGGNPIFYSSYLFRIDRHAVAADDVPQALHLRLQESVLGGFKLQTGTSESFEYLPQTTEVCLKV